MPTNNYINFNGNFIPNDTPVLTAENRAFHYGDALFETMHATGTIVQFFNEHFKRLTTSMRKLKMLVPPKFNTDAMHNEITRLLNKNRFYQGTRIRLTVFRNNGGLYTPATNDISYIIETKKIDNADYVLNKKGLKIGVFEQSRKPINIFSNLKTTNALCFIMAGLYKTENKLDDCIILNQENNIAEAISSNIFIVKDNNIYTPSLDDGCVAGIMREQIINIALSLNYTVFDDCSVKPDDLLTTDEVFLTNAVSGIRWIVAYEQKRYFNKIAKILITRLNEIAFCSPVT